MFRAVATASGRFEKAAMYVRKILEPNARPEDFRTVEPWFASTNNKWGLAWNTMATNILSNNKGTHQPSYA